MSNQTKKCRHCKTPIPEDAKVCYNCKRSQGFLLAKLESAAAFITVFSMILSIFLVILSWLQFMEATTQRNSADKAAHLAEQARDEARNNVENLRSNVKLMLEIDLLTPKLVLESYDRTKVDKVRRKLEEFAVPNEKEREKWLKALQ
jgi:flagellar biosynthesis component FlhA